MLNPNVLETRSNIAALRANASSEFPLIYLPCYTTLGDNGGGTFWLNSSDTTSSDNNISIFVDAAGNRWYRQFQGYVTPEMGGWVTGTMSTGNTAIFNAVTKYSYQTKLKMRLGAGNYKLNGTWNCTYTPATGAAVSSNSGFVVEGAGGNQTFISFNMPTPNAGIGWDLTGASQCTFRDFAIGCVDVINGTPTNTGPLVTALFGAENSSGFIFSGIMDFHRVVFFNNAPNGYTLYWAGAEQFTFHDCSAYQFQTGSAKIVEITASSQTSAISSAIVTTYNPVASATDIHWFKGSGVLFTNSIFGINFHFDSPVTGNGGVADIWFDGYVSSGSNITVAPLPTLFTDDTNGSGGQICRVGGRDLAIEPASTHFLVAELRATQLESLRWEGYTALGSTFTGLFTFGTNLFASVIEWVSNTQGAGAANTVTCTVGAPGSVFRLPDVNSNNVVAAPTSGMFEVAAKDGTFVVGPTVGSVSTITPIYTLRSTGAWGQGNLVTVTGQDSGLTDRFADLLLVSNSSAQGTVDVIHSGSVQGSPSARTYSMVSNVLNLTMASGTYTVQINPRVAGIV